LILALCPEGHCHSHLPTVAARTNGDRSLVDTADVPYNYLRDQRIEIVGGEPHYLYREIAWKLKCTLARVIAAQIIYSPD